MVGIFERALKTTRFKDATLQGVVIFDEHGHGPYSSSSFPPEEREDHDI
jgi:hypothetical protein